jgi:hypothetical protein
MKSVRLLQALRDRQAVLSGNPHSLASSEQRGLTSPFTRRRFMQTGLGVLAAGAAIGRQLVAPEIAYAAGDDPVPVSGSPFLAPFNVWAPIFVDSIDAEPSTIGNFNGVVGIAYVSGAVTRTNLQTGAVRVLPFVDADMRFMQGVYRGVDGKARQGTFGFV